MSWGLSLRIQSVSGSHDLAVHLGRDEGATAKVSGPVRAAATLLLCGPLLWALGDGVMRALHMLAPATVSSVVPPLIRAWAFLGPVLALAVNLWWSGHMGLKREGKRAVSREFSLTLDAVSLLLIVSTVFLVIAFYGHLLADAWACSNGVRSAC